MTNLTAITPIDDRVTENNHCIYWTLPWLGLLKPALRHYVRAFCAKTATSWSASNKGCASARR